ncbi:RidA family protein [Acuticoccus sp. M5D2P5]|uniref:RidA family protein n=1 Tax=Acuticoccus kalidii TaxID=2910977 RepID=UPI001F362BAC|nr:RidA family protein [Acuticoccus kalidii]MCF3933073.1 RidA family protein [Acuticoccus kalidii]
MLSLSRGAAVVAAVLTFAPIAAHAQEFTKENFNYSEFAKNAFSEAVVITGPAKMIYLAGIGSEDPDDGSVRHTDDFLEQCRFAWSKVKSALEKNGATLADIVKATSYVTDIRYRQEMRDCRTETFEGIPLPPHTFLHINSLARPGMMFEVDVVAAVPATE